MSSKQDVPPQIHTTITEIAGSAVKNGNEYAQIHPAKIKMSMIVMYTHLYDLVSVHAHIHAREPIQCCT